MLAEGAPAKGAPTKGALAKTEKPKKPAVPARPGKTAEAAKPDDGSPSRIRRAAAVLTRRGDRAIGYVALGLVAVLIAASVIVGLGAADALPKLGNLGAWLPSSGNGSASHVNGPTGRTDGRVPLPGTQGHPIQVAEDGTSILVVDQTTGVVSRIDPAQLSVPYRYDYGTPGLRLVSGGGSSWLVDEAQGGVRQINPLDLQPLSAALDLGDKPVGRAQADSRGTLWVPLPGKGQIVPVRGAVPGVAVAVAAPGSPLRLTLAGDRPVVTDPWAGTVTVVTPGGPTRQVTLPTVFGQGDGTRVLTPETTPGAVVPVLAGDTGTLVLVDLDKGSVTAVSLGIGAAAGSYAPPQVLGGRVYIPDRGHGNVIVYDTAKAQFDPQIAVTGKPGPLDSFVRDGMLWVNDQNSSAAAVIDAAGVAHPVGKYAADSPAGAGVAASDLPGRNTVDWKVPPGEERAAGGIGVGGGNGGNGGNGRNGYVNGPVGPGPAPQSSVPPSGGNEPGNQRPEPPVTVGPDGSGSVPVLPVPVVPGPVGGGNGTGTGTGNGRPDRTAYPGPTRTALPPGGGPVVPTPTAPATTEVPATTAPATTAPATTPEPPTTTEPPTTPPTTLPTTSPPTTEPPTLPQTPPGAPEATSGPGRIVLAFPPASGATPTGYTLTNLVSGQTVSPSTIAPGERLQFTVSGGSCDKEYAYKVVAHYDGGASATSTASTPVRPCTAPGSVGTVTATPSATGDGGTLGWTAAAAHGASKVWYTVKVGGGPDQQTGATTFAVAGLANGKKYPITVTAANAAGSGPASNASLDLTAPPKSPGTGQSGSPAPSSGSVAAAPGRLPPVRPAALGL
ncbi:hypothetical protein ACPA54_21345 [Uniformispora flossi]|uniref:hypothetical protein n=1 Tax=Uniformispora flossi TaxID=3390723 RepID=UPI003C2F4A72